MGKKELPKNWGKPKKIKTVTQIVSEKSILIPEPVKLTPLPDSWMPDKIPPYPSPLLGRPQDPPSPNEKYNEESQYARYEKALNIGPVKIEEYKDPTTGKNSRIFFYGSNESNSGYWEVERLTRDVSISFLRSLNIFGNATYQVVLDLDVTTNAQFITEHPDDYDEWIWEQVEGVRTVLVSDNTITPSIFLLGSSGGTGIVSRAKPIVLRASLDGDKTTFDDLIIFTIPVSSFRNAGLKGSGWENEFTLDWHFLPRYSNKAFKWTDGTINVSWSYPNGDRGELTNNIPYVVLTRWLINDNGQYEEFSFIQNTETRTVELEWGKHYKAFVEYDYYQGIDNNGVSKDIAQRAFSRSLSDGRTRGLSDGRVRIIEPDFKLAPFYDTEEGYFSRKIYIQPPTNNFGYLFGNDSFSQWMVEPRPLVDKLQVFSEIFIRLKTYPPIVDQYRSSGLLTSFNQEHSEIFITLNRYTIVDSTAKYPSWTEGEVRVLSDGRVRGLIDGRIRGSVTEIGIRGLSDDRIRGLSDGRRRRIRLPERLYQAWGSILAAEQSFAEVNIVGGVIG